MIVLLIGNETARHKSFYTPEMTTKFQAWFNTTTKLQENIKISLIEQAPNASEKARLKNLWELAGKKKKDGNKNKQLGKIDAAV